MIHTAIDLTPLRRTLWADSDQDEEVCLNTAQPVPHIDNRMAGLAGVRHGFFTREGGVSTGIYAGLNVGKGSNDDPEAVHENRCRVAASLGTDVDCLATVHQIHSDAVVTIGSHNKHERPRADAMVTNVPGIALGVLTADCGPVLFADAKAGVIGAAHAGWRGAVDGVLENTITAMEALGAHRADILAVLGPSISAKSYEVGPEFVERLVALDRDNSHYLTDSVRPGHAMFDLPSYSVGRLQAAGVAAHDVALCTYLDERLFYSYRRTTHRGEPDYGRQISAIKLD
jgi:YfiH family protein